MQGEKGLPSDIMTVCFLLFLIVKVAVAVALEILICNLLTELAAHTLVFLGALKATGTVASGSL